MALPSSGQISLSQINAELGKATTASVSLNDADVRALAGVPSGAISFSNFHGKSAELYINYATASQNVNLRTVANNGGFSGATNSKVRIRLSAAITSTSTSTPAVEVGSWPSGTTLIVEVAAVITGKGGAGGAGGYKAAGQPGGAGGPAIKATYAISGGSISVIALAGANVRGGGGGGGGGGGHNYTTSGTILDGGGQAVYATGGVGGRGAGTDGLATAGAVVANAGDGGSGGNYGASGSSGVALTYSGGGGGAGGPAFSGSTIMTLSGWSSGVNYIGSVS